jgi:hypothetical protein
MGAKSCAEKMHGTVSHGVCPSCEAKYFPDLAAPVAGQPAGKLAVKNQDVPVGTDATGAVQ